MRKYCQGKDFRLIIGELIKQREESKDEMGYIQK